VVLEVLDGVDATDHRRRELAERRPHEVLTAERPCAPDLRRLLAFEPGVDGQLTLALERDAFAIQTPGDDHPSEDRPELVDREPHVGVPDGLAVGRQDAHRVGSGCGLRDVGHA
jgi:hypothetical protein